MATLSLNGEFNYPIELKQSLVVDGKATFNSKVSQGVDNATNGQHSYTFGDSCSANADFSRACGEKSLVGESGRLSLADGYACSSFGERSYTLGYKTVSRTIGIGVNCDDSFVWQGNTNGDLYYSKGSGTFCINPYGTGEEDSSSLQASSIAVCGFFIGENCITDYISSESAKRILTNPNVFTASQVFDEDVTFNGTTLFKNQNTFEGMTVFTGTTNVPVNNDPSSVIKDNAIASHEYVNGIALSAIANVGKYYSDDITETDFNALDDFSVSLGFLSSYVESAINNVDEFLDDRYSEMGSAASREYTLNLATSASTHILSSDNIYTGINGFRGDVNIYGKLTSQNTATIDLKLGKILVSDVWNKNDENPNTISTQRFTRTVATSAVEQILNHGNVYKGSSGETNVYNIDTRFSSEMHINSKMTMEPNSIADMRYGKVYIGNPASTSNDENEPSTTMFSRSVAASAVNELLTRGGVFSYGSLVTFNGDVRFNKDVDAKNANFSVKNLNVADSSNYAASTKFVKDAIFETLSTSSTSVKSLILDGNQSSKTNNFVGTTNNFLNENIFVSTMPNGCADEHAASCEFVHNIASGIFDLFDTKFTDHILPSNSRWKLQGSKILGANTEVYRHILSDITGLNESQTTIVTPTGNSKIIRYYMAKDGHKIVMFNKSSVIDSLFQETGIAWFYVLNTERNNEFVILPRSSYNFKILPYTSTSSIDALKRPEIGGYVPPSLPSHTHHFRIYRSADGSHGSTLKDRVHHGADNDCSSISKDTDNAKWTDSNGNTLSINGGKTVQPPATHMFLYFFCG